MCRQHRAAFNAAVACDESARPAIYRARIRWIRVVGLMVVIVAIGAALGSQSKEPSSSTGPVSSTARPPGRVLDRQHVGPLGEAGGAIPAGTTVFDAEVPGVGKLDPALLGALRKAAIDAGQAGVGFVVNSGWRSAAYEDQLRREAIVKYGSEDAAARWVATGRTSAHVRGEAVDVGPSRAATWLSAHGAEYGLCQIYANEPWHYELRPEASAYGCPAMYADPTHDPRMRR
jgi:hypothetical protein